MRSITFLVHPQFELLDLSGPVAVFNLANERRGGDGYALTVASATGGLVRERAGLLIDSQPFEADTAEGTLIAVGGPVAHLNSAGSQLVEGLRSAAGRAGRLASVCTGAFLLGAAGLLDERRATTHWRYAGLLQTLYPRVRLDADRIFIRDGPVWTSAGMSAGIDLALALLEHDFDAALARDVARDMVVYYRRTGGQSQFSTLLELTPEPGRMRKVLDYARTHLREPLPVERLAIEACLSPRQFSRTFFEATGETPARAVERLRLEAARPRIETETTPFESIARDTGFGSVEKLRRSCLKLYGRTPQELRRAARRQVPSGVSGAAASGPETSASGG